MLSLRKEIESAINRNSAEGPSNTPDFILAEFLTSCLAAFNKAQHDRAAWYGHMDAIDGPVLVPPLTPAAEQGDCTCYHASGNVLTRESCPVHGQPTAEQAELIHTEDIRSCQEHAARYPVPGGKPSAQAECLHQYPVTDQGAVGACTRCGQSAIVKPSAPAEKGE